MAVNQSYVPSTPFTFNNANRTIDVPWETLSSEHVKLYTIVDSEMTPIDESKYEVRGNQIFMNESMLPEDTTFYVRRKVDLLQPYTSQGVNHVRPRDLERALDRVIMAAQELQSRELFTHIMEDFQSIGYIQYEQGWRLGADGYADISGHFKGEVNITSGVIDGRTVEIIGSTTHRQSLDGFADVELGSVDTPTINGLKVDGTGRYISVFIQMTRLFAGSRIVHLQISKDNIGWFSLPESPDPAAPESWKGTGGGHTQIEGTDTFIGPLPIEVDGNGEPIPTTYYIRVRGATVSGDTTGWTTGVSAVVAPVAGDMIAAGAIVASKIAAGAIVAGKIDANAVVAGNIAAASITADELSAGLLSAMLLQVTDSIEVTSEGLIGTSDDGNRRIVITSDKLVIQQWADTAWVTVQQIGGVLESQFLPWFYGSGLVDMSIDIDDLDIGTERPANLNTFPLRGDYENQNGVDPWDKSNVTFSEPGRFVGTALAANVVDGYIETTTSVVELDFSWSAGCWVRTMNWAPVEEEAVFTITDIPTTAYSIILFGCPWDRVLTDPEDAPRHSLNIPADSSLQDLVDAINALNAWTASETGADEVTITAAYSGLRPTPTSTTVTITVVNAGSPERAVLTIRSADDEFVQARLFEGHIRWLSVGNNFLRLSEFTRSSDGYDMIHASGLWSSLVCQVGANSDQQNTAALGLDGGARVRVDVSVDMGTRVSELWFSGNHLDLEDIEDYRTAMQPWGSEDFRNKRIQARSGRDIHYVTTGGGVHRFDGPVTGSLQLNVDWTVQPTGSARVLTVTGVGDVDLDHTGIGGLDAGSPEVDTTYHIFVVYSGATLGLICSKVLTPELPSGWTSPVYVNSRVTDGSSNFLQVRQFGDYNTYTTGVGWSQAFPSAWTSYKVTGLPKGLRVLADFTLVSRFRSSHANGIVTYFWRTEGADERQIAGHSVSPNSDRYPDTFNSGALRAIIADQDIQLIYTASGSVENFSNALTLDGWHTAQGVSV